MNKKSKEFLHKLLLTPSPTGFEEHIQKVVKKYASQFCDSVTTDLHGNCIFTLNPKAKRRVMLAGHCDQIGFMVRHIDKNGFLYIDPLGGIDAGVLPGTRVQVHTEKKTLLGVFGRKPIHQQAPDERTQLKLDLDQMWIDIGARSAKDAKSKVNIGDPVTFELEIGYLNSDLICSPGLDDKVGLFVVIEALRLCAQSRKKPNLGIYAVSTVQEEVGLRGAKTSAYGIDPEIGLAVDVTHASDNPAVANLKSAPCVLGKGAGIYHGPNVNPVVYKQLLQVAKKHKLPHQILPSSRLLGNDANALQVNKSGVAAGSIGIPNRYMHTQVEVCHLKDLENSAKLIAEFVLGIKPNQSFIP